MSAKTRARTKSASDDQILHKFDFAGAKPEKFSFQRLSSGKEQISGLGAFSVQNAMLDALDGKVAGLLEADFCEVSVSLQIADRFSPRVPKGRRDVAGLWWARHIKVRLPVRCPERWNETAVRRGLEEYLCFNTGDKWELEFVTRINKFPVVVAETLEDLEQERFWRRGTPIDLDVVLFSGGIDSTGGVASQSRAHPNRHFLLVSVDTNCITDARQADIVRALPTNLKDRVTPVRLGYQLEDAERLDADYGDRSTAKTLRTRALLFLTAATLVARRVGQKRFYVYENGIGAINLAFDRSQVAGQANRATNPKSLFLFGAFVTALFREQMVVDNPFLFETKATLCRALDTLDWHQIIPLTFTCGHPQRVKGKGILHCGICTSCILRRQGFRAANMHTEDKARYHFALDAPVEDSTLSKKFAEWLKMGSQFRAIERAINTAFHYPESWKHLCKEFPELRELGLLNSVAFDGASLSSIELQVRIVKLLRAYVNEGLELTPIPLEKLIGGEATAISSEQRAA